ncbi:hypothetical protein ACFLZW_06005 [Chloroflexota bacterium]
MDTVSSTIIGFGLSFLVIFLVGILLARSGKPHNTLFLTIHKLISLAALVFLYIAISKANQAAGLSMFELTAAIVTGLFFVGAIITGGLVSTGNPMPAFVERLHKTTPYLTVLTTAVTLTLLLSRQ